MPASCCSITIIKLYFFPVNIQQLYYRNMFIFRVPMSSCWLVDRHRASETHGYEKALCGYNITCLKNKCLTSTHRELKKTGHVQVFTPKRSTRPSTRPQSPTVVEQHHRTGPTSTEDVCTHTSIVEQTQGSTWQLKHSRHIREALYRTQQWNCLFLSSLLLFTILFDQVFLFSFDVYRTTIFT
jgi:hypothetical protein